jgi:hypothetical protein
MPTPVLFPAPCRRFALLLAGLVVFAAPAAADDRPDPVPTSGDNILFIVIDDLNDWIGVMDGHPGLGAAVVSRSPLGNHH